MLGYFWRKWFSRSKSATIRKRSQRPPRLEQLEDRCLLAAVIAQFPVSASSGPAGIATGPDGNIWFTEAQAGQIGMINPTTHAITEYPIPTATGSPSGITPSPLGITAGPDGNLWFTDPGTNQIGMISPSSHTITEYPILTANSDPTSITTGPDGNVWFTETATDQIGVINPSSGTIAEFLIPTANNSPSGITAGPDGNLWFTESASSKIATIQPITKGIIEYATPSANSQPAGIVTGSDGNIWFTETSTNRIARVNLTTPGIIEFPVLTTKSHPTAITAGSDGNLWFIESSANKIGTMSVTTGAMVVETIIPTAKSSAAAITTGPGGGIWFTETNNNQVDQVIAAPVVTATPINATVVEGQTATFLATAIGLPVPTVQWLVSTNAGLTFTPLSNGGVYSGVNNATMTITGATATMNGYIYKAVFTNIVSSATTAPATLTVNSVLSIVPAFPQGLINATYNQTVSVVGSTSPFNLFLVNNFNAGGTGLTLANITTNSINGTITVSGTSATAGTVTFTVAIANAAGNTLTQNLAIKINPLLSIATPSLPPATAGVNYVQTISVIGGIMPYATFGVTNFNPGATGLSPAAFTVPPTGGAININATPIAGGTVTFTVNVTDSAGTALTKDYTITVNPPLAITPSLPAGTAGTNYQQTVTVTGGGVPYTTFAVSNFNTVATGLTPSNLTTNAAAGTVTISGTPSAAGTITFTVNVVDAIGAPLNKTYTITINPPLSITSALPQGTAGAAYHQTITVAGGSKPYMTFTVTGFSGGATGLTSAAIVTNAATGAIVVSATPSAAGPVAFTVNVTDAAGATLTKTFNIAINPAPTISNLTVSQWTSGKSGFTGTMTISGGTVPHTLVSASGLPDGLIATLTGNTIGFTGTPSIVGTYAVGSVTIHDAAGASVTKTFSITINAALTIGNLTAAQWTIGRAGFNGVITAGGGTGGLSIVSSTGLPTGLSIVLIGNTVSFTGTPITIGAFAGSVTLRDSVGATVTRTFTITINAPPTIGNLTTSQWTQGASGFNGTLAISAGTTPHLITVQSGLPTGLKAIVVGTSINFTGTPTAAGTYNCSVTIVDAAGASVTKTFSIIINPPVVITTASFAATKMAVLYTTSVQAKGGTGALTYSLTAGSLPPGIRLTSDGVISGISRSYGSFTFTITATDAIGANVSKTYVLTLSLR